MTFSILSEAAGMSANCGSTTSLIALVSKSRQAVVSACSLSVSAAFVWVAEATSTISVDSAWSAVALLVDADGWPSPQEVMSA